MEEDSMNAFTGFQDDALPLFDSDIEPQFPFKPTLGNPVSHTNDPPTSREAATTHTLNGKRAKHAKLVLKLVTAKPGCTAVELYHHAPADMQAELKEMQEVRRRLTDLHAAGLVCQRGQRMCQVKGTTQVVWFATEEQR
jgi:hypothetical protein